MNCIAGVEKWQEQTDKLSKAERERNVFVLTSLPFSKANSSAGQHSSTKLLLTNSSSAMSVFLNTFCKRQVQQHVWNVRVSRPTKELSGYCR